MGSSNTPMDAHPRHGFSPLTPFDGSLTNATLVTAAIPRVAGLRYVVVPGIFTLVAGAGSVQLFLEGCAELFLRVGRWSVAVARPA